MEMSCQKQIQKYHPSRERVISSATAVSTFELLEALPSSPPLLIVSSLCQRRRRARCTVTQPPPPLLPPPSPRPLCPSSYSLLSILALSAAAARARNRSIASSPVDARQYRGLNRRAVGCVHSCGFFLQPTHLFLSSTAFTVNIKEPFHNDIDRHAQFQFSMADSRPDSLHNLIHLCEALKSAVAVFGHARAR